MRWKRYPKYKDSGVEWLGDVPKAWSIHRLKYGATLVNEKIDGAECDLPYTGLEHVESWTGKRINRDAGSSSEGQANRYRQGDVLFGKLRPYLAKVLKAGEEGICTGELLVLRPKLVQQNYLFSYLLTRDFISIVDSSTYGAKMPRANWEFIGNLPTLVPPEDEQRAIAAFLDRETGRIDALIEKKQRQLELLGEKRAALISHAVTKGLNPNVKMKDSGIEWLGEIPEHWEVCLFKRVANINYGMSGELDKTLTEGTSILSLPNVNIDGNLVLDNIPFVDLSDSQKPEYLLQNGDLLFNWRNGSANHLGKTAYFNLGGEYTHVSFLLRLRFDLTKHDSRYFYHLLNGLRITGFFFSSKAGVNNTFNQSELKNLWIMVPPFIEQKHIADFIESNVHLIDNLIAKIMVSIKKLREYRTALISAAVTGKIDVRREAA